MIMWTYHLTRIAGQIIRRWPVQTLVILFVASGIGMIGQAMKAPPVPYTDPAP